MKNTEWASFRQTREYEESGALAKAIAELRYLWEMAKQAVRPKPKYIEKK